MKQIRLVVIELAILVSLSFVVGQSVAKQPLSAIKTNEVNKVSVRIAIVDSEMAVLESDDAKKYAKESASLFAPRIKKLKDLQEDIQNMEKKLEKDSPILTELQRDNRQLEIKRKYEDLQLQDRQLRMDKSRSDQAELGKIRPKLDGAIETVAKKMGYDLVLEKGAVRFMEAELDITRMIIERINQIK
ncbi:MAG: OmpH family outer membrane protein [Candidatus Endonucleobacter bathymodioli]|uniref:OmpH family outer membrane protein n=1 Tax=Candidatus Endonucleibacter bathymodioli TaxID=539814 RepID=A0AA90NVM7_9GAMM|nr:OmpH family outer membrane protein [Candidatus Endonucleobacter bathymodioli]